MTLEMKLYERLDKPQLTRLSKKTPTWRLGCNTWVVVIIMVTLTLIIVAPILKWESQTLETKAVENTCGDSDTLPPPTIPRKLMKRSLRSSTEPLNLQFIENKEGMIQFDMCSVVHCETKE